MNHVGPIATQREPLGPWREQALCRDLDTTDFYPTTQEGEELAKQVCTSCPVKGPCLQYALRNHELGIWGGTADWERGMGPRRKRGRPVKAQARKITLPLVKGKYISPTGARKSSAPPPGPNPLCECGCGEEVSWANSTWSRWKRGHWNRVPV